MRGEYHLGYCAVRALRALAEGEREHHVLNRLEEGRGDADDMRLAASLYKGAGDSACARDLLAMISVEDRFPWHSEEW